MFRQELAHAFSRGGCPGRLCFDSGETSGFLAVLAGVLAGIAFLALISLLQEGSGRTRQRSRRGLESVIVVFVSAFLALVVSTFLYSLVPGEVRLSARSELLSLLAGSAFSLSISELLLGLVLLLYVRGFAQASRDASWIIALFVPAVIYLYVAIGVRDVETVSSQAPISDLCIWVPSASLPLMIAALGQHLQRAGRGMGKWVLGPRVARIAAKVTLTGVLGITVLSGYVGDRPLRIYVPRAWHYAFLACVLAVLAAWALLVLAIRVGPWDRVRQGRRSNPGRYPWIRLRSRL
jgi:hypothetical protein